jgi:hypothetical protein
MSEERKAPDLRSLLRAAGRDASAQDDKLERELWRRNARFRALAQSSPLRARWAQQGANYLFTLGCEECRREVKVERDALGFAVRGVEKIIDLIERKATNTLNRFFCAHALRLHAPDSEETLAIIELELLIGG